MEIEVDLRRDFKDPDSSSRGENGKNADKGPLMIVVGLPDTAVKESKDRVLSAISNSGYSWAKGRILVNLAPAHVKKEGPGFDLPIALGVIAASERVHLPRLDEFLFVGELALNGDVRPVRGVLAIALEARRKKKRAICVPLGNAQEAALVPGIEVYGIKNLVNLVEALRSEDPWRALSSSRVKIDAQDILRRSTRTALDFSDVKGQPHVKRAIEVAVAGSHNILMMGPPGSGKSMLAKRIPGIMPPLTMEEALEVTKIHSVAGLIQRSGIAAVSGRPFRSPHQTISDVGLIGGSSIPTPGEISIAHHGVLFLDELPEFRRTTLEVMRQPLEDGKVTISRASGSATFPTEFMLVAAMNPCPCGYWGSRQRKCQCNATQVHRYRQRLEWTTIGSY